MKMTRVLIRATLALVALPLVCAAAFMSVTGVLNRTNGAIVSGGVKREYVLYVPRSYSAARPTALVISLHGAGAWPEQQRNLTHWDRLADEFGFLVVYPAAHARVWRVNHPGAPVETDVEFIADLIDTLEARYHIDRRRVYANGFSLGGAMT